MVDELCSILSKSHNYDDVRFNVHIALANLNCYELIELRQKLKPYKVDSYQWQQELERNGWFESKHYPGKIFFEKSNMKTELNDRIYL
jgi:hypothetical protein